MKKKVGYFLLCFVVVIGVVFLLTHVHGKAESPIPQKSANASDFFILYGQLNNWIEIPTYEDFFDSQSNAFKSDFEGETDLRALYFQDEVIGIIAEYKLSSEDLSHQVILDVEKVENQKDLYRLNPVFSMTNGEYDYVTFYIYTQNHHTNFMTWIPQKRK